MPQVNAIGTVMVCEVVENMAAPVGVVDAMHLATRGGTEGSVRPTDIVHAIANRVVIGTRVVAVKDPRTTVVTAGRGRSGNIVDIVGDESYMRAVIVESG